MLPLFRIFVLALFLPLVLGAEAKGMMNVPEGEFLGRKNIDIFNASVRAMRSGTDQTAVLGFTAVANRYHDGLLNPKENAIALRSMINLSYIYGYNLFDYSQAMMWLQKAQDTAEKHHLDNDLPVILLNRAGITLLNYDMYGGDIDKTAIVGDYVEAYAAALRLSQWDDAILALSNMVEIAFNDNLTQAIEKETAQFSRMKLPSGVPMHRYMLHLCKAVSHINHERYADALHALDEAEKAIDTKNSPERYRIIIAKDRSIIYAKMGNTQQAKQALLQALHLCQKEGARDAQTEIYQRLADFEGEQGHQAAASAYRLRYFESKDSLLRESKLGSVASMEFAAEVNKLNNQMSALAARKQMQTVLLWVSLAFLIAIAAFLAFTIKQNRKLRERNRKLYLNSRNALQEETQASEQPAPKYQRSALREDDKDNLLKQVLQVMADSDRVCGDDFSLSVLADKSGIPAKYVSQLINEKYGCTFKTLVTRYRIKQACRLLSDATFSQRNTIEAISEHVGFKSRSAFVAAFKREVGLTPSEYLKEAQRDE